MIEDLEKQLFEAIIKKEASLIGKTQRDPQDDFSWNEYYEWNGSICKVAWDNKGWFMWGCAEYIPLNSVIRKPHSAYIKKAILDRLRLQEYQQSMKRVSHND